MSTGPLERIITADDIIRGGACYGGVMTSASEEWPAAFTVKAAVTEARAQGEAKLVRNALKLDGYGDGNGDGNGNGYGNGDGNGYGDGYGYGYGYGDGDGNGYGYGYGYGDGNGNGYGYGNGGFSND